MLYSYETIKEFTLSGLGCCWSVCPHQEETITKLSQTLIPIYTVKYFSLRTFRIQCRSSLVNNSANIPIYAESFMNNLRHNTITIAVSFNHAVWKKRLIGDMHLLYHFYSGKIIGFPHRTFEYIDQILHLKSFFHCVVLLLCKVNAVPYVKDCIVCSLFRKLAICSSKHIMRL